MSSGIDAASLENVRQQLNLAILRVAPQSDLLAILHTYAIMVNVLVADRDSWKKRAAQHGCNVEEGDHECG